MARARIWIGCSGWQYRHWRGDLYPRDLPQDRWLAYYAERFDTVEINNSFYRLPEADTFAAWAAQSPDGFRVAVKASRYLTHLKRLRDPADPLERLWSRAERLGCHLGPMLYQLPPRWHRDLERLSAFVAAAPGDREQAIEFRDPSWYHDDVFQLLGRAGLALCLHDITGAASPREPVGPFVYVRFHGTAPGYGGGYSAQALSAWADRLATWSAEGCTCYAYFNNDVGGHAFRDADRLREMVDRRTG